MLEPSILSSAVHLARIELDEAIVAAAAAASAPRSSSGDASSSSSSGGGRGEVRDVSMKGGGAALLAAMASLPHLQELECSRCRLEWPEPSADYKGLAASDKLRSLIVRGSGELPQLAWLFVFPHGRTLGCLRQLVLHSGHAGSRWGAGAVNALAQCCASGLQDVKLQLQGGMAAAALKQLTKLTRLDLSVYHSEGGSNELPASMESIAALSSLRSLSINLDRAVENEVLLPLTELTQLTTCCISWPGNYWTLQDKKVGCVLGCQAVWLACRKLNFKLKCLLASCCPATKASLTTVVSHPCVCCVCMSFRAAFSLPPPSHTLSLKPHTLQASAADEEQPLEVWAQLIQLCLS